MKKICKNCAFFRYDHFTKNEHECSNPHFKYTGDFNTEEPDSDDLSYSDYEGYSASFNVGKNFGCIHWKQKERLQQ